MNIKNEEMIEKKLIISETDVVNGGEVVVLIAYAVKQNKELYSFPAPQIYNLDIYNKNKAFYDNKVIEFRTVCGL